MNVVVSFFTGAVAAIIASIPVGPITFAIIQATLNSGRRSGIMVAAGALVIEVFFIVIAVFGLGTLVNEELIHKYMGIVAIPVLFLLGFISLFKKEKEFSDDKPAIKAHNYILIGATLCFTNPIIVGYWLWITATLQNAELIHNTTPDRIFYVTGIIIGVALFFFAVIQFTYYKKQSISISIRNKINIGLGLFFIAFGCYLSVLQVMKWMS
jgi:threonine/homoserine/homoserine lactone efflux protein